MVTIPRLVIAAPASGCGKTTVATALMAALRARGHAVSGHKVGPDYIDPGYHALATGRPGRNLDPFLCGEDLMGPLFAHGATGAQIAVIEGVMGLFDGVADPAASGLIPDYASTAHVARLLNAPVILVVDAAAAGRSVAALIGGFAAFDPRVRVAGVIFNRVGSPRHERLLREATEAIGVGVFGAIRRTDAVITPARHLGLVPVAEWRAAAQGVIAQLAQLVASSCDMAGLLALAATAPSLACEPWDPFRTVAACVSRSESSLSSASTMGAPPDVRPPQASPPLVAVAEGPAFTFSYTEHGELLEAAGAHLAPFDPMTDEDLPDGAAGLVIGGGFPEIYAAQLSANVPLRRRVAEFAGQGGPVVAECAGLLYLSRTLDSLPMCGVIDAETQMSSQLTLGYRTGAAASDSVLARAGEPVRGHEFHRSVADPRSGARPAWRLSGPGAGRAEGHVTGNILASYLHTHWARTPSFAARFAVTCRAGGRRAAGGNYTVQSAGKRFAARDAAPAALDTAPAYLPGAQP